MILCACVCARACMCARVGVGVCECVRTCMCAGTRTCVTPTSVRTYIFFTTIYAKLLQINIICQVYYAHICFVNNINCLILIYNLHRLDVTAIEERKEFKGNNNFRENSSFFVVVKIATSLYIKANGNKLFTLLIAYKQQ